MEALVGLDTISVLRSAYPRSEEIQVPKAARVIERDMKNVFIAGPSQVAPRKSNSREELEY